MSRVGLVLGGGGITGAAWEMAAITAIELATGWNANDADVVVGTSAGAYVAALLRADKLNLDTLALPHESEEEIADRIRSKLYAPSPGADLSKWLKKGLLPGLLKPGLRLAMGSPAKFDAGGIGAWLEEQIGPTANEWPDQHTIVVAYDLDNHARVAFGTQGAPPAGLAEATAASSAIPLIFRPYSLNGSQYVDGGVMSGTHADLLLGAEQPLDLIIVMTPMAAAQGRRRALPHERLLDRVGRKALDQELEMIKEEWPETEILILWPAPWTLAVMRPNFMDASAAVPTFMRSLLSMRRVLANPKRWEILERHLAGAQSHAHLRS